MRPGDGIVMTKWAAVEGTSIVVEDFADRLSGLPASVIASASSLCGQLSIVPESRIAMQYGATAMHDVTEGGVLGALWELGFSNGCGVEIETDRIPVREDTRALCAALRLDPLRLIGSGSLLIADPDAWAFVGALQKGGIPARKIGRAIAGTASFADGKELCEPHADELYRLYAKAK